MEYDRPIKRWRAPHFTLVNQIWNDLPTWQAYLIAVDGRDGVGKTALATFLALHLDIPVIHADLLTERDAQIPYYKVSQTREMINARLSADRPVIIEGSLILRLLSLVQIEPDFVVHVEKRRHQGSGLLQDEFRRYESAFDPRDRADFAIVWQETD